MSLGIVAQRGNARAIELAADIRRSVRSEVDTRLDEITADVLDVDGWAVGDLTDAILVVSIGGDGTFLFTARHVGGTPIIGVNLGEVGFLNAVSPEEAVAVIRTAYDQALAGDLPLQEFPKLIATHGDDRLGPALNEVVVHGPHRGRSHLVEVTVEVDGEHYTTEHADGVMVSTPTGTTAYNLSEAGPLLAPGVSGLVVNVLSGYPDMPSLVVPLDATIRLTVDGGGTAFAIADGRDRNRISPPTTVTVQRAETPVRIAGPPVEFFDALEKLDTGPVLSDEVDQVHRADPGEVEDVNGKS